MPVPLEDTDLNLRLTLHRLFDQYGMAGVAQVVELMRSPHQFRGSVGSILTCRACGQHLGSDLHGTGQAAH